MNLNIKRQFEIKYNNGDIIENITIINFEYHGIKGTNYYNCKCSCGKIFLARERDIELKIVTSCGHDKKYRFLHDLSGKKFGMLTVERFDHMTNTDHKAYYLCTCDCGNKVIMSGYNIQHIKIPSCGCLSLKIQLEKRTKHNMYNTRFYSIWSGIKLRCDKETCSNYNNYGGRGITYDPRWEKFENFRDDMYDSYCKHAEEYGENNTSIDRIDVNGNYCKENCRWSTYHEQLINRRNSVYITINNKLYNECEAYELFADKSILQYSSFTKRIRDGVDPTIAIFLPISLNCNGISGERRKYLEEQYKLKNIPIKYLPPSESNKMTDLLNKLRESNIFKKVSGDS